MSLKREQYQTLPSENKLVSFTSVVTEIAIGLIVF